VAAYGSSVYLAGYFQGALVGFGNGVQSVSGSSDAFVAKVTDNGTSSSPGWVVRAGGTHNEQALALAAISTGAYVTGYFTSNAPDFGTLTLTNSGPASSADLFVGKLADAGGTATFTWVRQSSGTADELGTALAVQGSQVYVAGSFGSSQVGSVGASFGATQLANAGLRDVFIAKIADAGPNSAFVWALGAGGVGNDAASALAIGGTSVVMGGYAIVPAAFGTIALSGTRTGLTGVLASVGDATLTAAQASTAQGPAAYPNPAAGRVHLSLPLAATRVELLDALGRTVQSVRAQAGAATLDVTGLAPGLYHWRVPACPQPAGGPLLVE
jgi:hypothetical protein